LVNSFKFVVSFTRYDNILVMKETILLFKNPESNLEEHYGGNQDWYSSNTRAMAGCSSVAGANCLRALCMTDKECFNLVKDNKLIPPPIKKALISTKCLKDDFLMLMTGVYEVMRAMEIFPLNRIYDRKNRDNKFFKYVKPNNGRSSIGFISGLLRYAGKMGLYLKYHAMPTAFVSKEEAISFIDKGLKESGSIVILTSYNKHSLKLFHPTMMKHLFELPEKSEYNECPCADAFMKCHFATITGRRGNEVMISTWGKIATASLDDLVKSWHSLKAWESTLFYFTPTDKSETKKSLFKSWIPFVKGIAQAICRRSF